MKSRTLLLMSRSHRGGPGGQNLRDNRHRS
jgi:hypothetical protein